MKSSVSIIFSPPIFYTHLVQIQTPEFLLKSSIYQSFSLILQFELHGFRFKVFTGYIQLFFVILERENIDQSCGSTGLDKSLTNSNIKSILICSMF